VNSNKPENDFVISEEMNQYLNHLTASLMMKLGPMPPETYDLVRESMIKAAIAGAKLVHDTLTPV
jgi:hypothetical protein